MFKRPNAFKTGEWYTIRLGVKLNTPGQSNGQLLFGINNDIRVLPGVMWRGSADMKIEKMSLQVFHGGPCDAEQDSTLSAGNFRVHRWD